MVVGDFSNKRVFLDTAPLIYYIEGGSKFQKVLDNLFGLNSRAKFTFVTSTVSLLEVLVKPLRDGRNDIAQQYRDILTKAMWNEMHDLTSDVAEVAAKFRANYNLRTPDAIQIASALSTKSNYFLTNDAKLKQVTDINVVTLDELAV